MSTRRGQAGGPGVGAVDASEGGPARRSAGPRASGRNGFIFLAFPSWFGLVGLVTSATVIMYATGVSPASVARAGGGEAGTAELDLPLSPSHMWPSPLAGGVAAASLRRREGDMVGGPDRPPPTTKRPRTVRAPVPRTLRSRGSTW